ncbi:MAG: hypothetical protein K6E19_06275 [Lachnospiraceae bacterium]|nr:hypothetical protein [Lachnospiraceae bacterium]
MRRILGLHRHEAYNIINLFTDELGSAFKQLGVLFDVVEEADDGSIGQIVQILEGQHYDAVIVFNAQEQQDYELNGENIWDKYDIPFYNYILDHPVEHQREMRKPYKDMNIITIDREHADLVSKWFPNVRSVHFVPDGGTGGINEMDYEKWCLRSNNVIYVGVHEDLNNMIDILSGYPKHTAVMIGNIIDLMLDDSKLSYYEAFRKIMTDLGILPDLNAEEELGYAIICRIASRYIRAYRREEIVRYILESEHEWKLHIFGDGWNSINEESNRRAILHETLPYSETIKLYEDSKIVLNVMSHFKNAILDRIPSAMLSGACVLSEKTEFLSKTIPGDAIFFYDTDMPNLVPEKISGILEDPQRAFDTAKRGHEYANTSLRWQNTAEELIKIIY